jgi:hypothetical protein
MEGLRKADKMADKTTRQGRIYNRVILPQSYGLLTERTLRPPRKLDTELHRLTLSFILVWPKADFWIDGLESFGYAQDKFTDYKEIILTTKKRSALRFLF